MFIICLHKYIKQPKKYHTLLLYLLLGVETFAKHSSCFHWLDIHPFSMFSSLQFYILQNIQFNIQHLKHSKIQAYSFSYIFFLIQIKYIRLSFIYSCISQWISKSKTLAYRPVSNVKQHYTSQILLISTTLVHFHRNRKIVPKML